MFSIPFRNTAAPKILVASLASFFVIQAACCGQQAFAVKTDTDKSYAQFQKSIAGKKGPVVPPPPTDKAAFQKYVQQGWDSPFGVDYVFVMGAQGREPDLVYDYGGVLGVRWVDFTRVEWQIIEKRKPRNGKHTYDWSGLDDGVRKWQYFGVHILMTLFSHSPWATATPSGDENVYLKGPMKAMLKGKTDYLPKPEHMQDFRDYIYNLVERYDGDGVDDMPGLRFPVLYYQIGNEYNNEFFWGGSVAEYKIFLKEAARAARRANPKVKIVLSGINFGEHSGFYQLQMEPRAAAFLADRHKKIKPPMKALAARMNAWSLEAVSFCDDYDVLDVRWAFYGVVKEGQMLLDKLGCKNKEIWSAEIYSYVPLEPDVLVTTGFLHPYPTPSKSKLYKAVLKNPLHPQFKKLNAWYRGLQSAQVVRYCMAALDAGTRKLMMGWALDGQSPLAPFPSAYDGLRSVSRKKIWPAGYTYGQLARKLDGLQKVNRLSTPPNTYVYQCTVRDGRKVIVAFFDDFIAQNHDEPLGSARVTLPFGAKAAQVTHVITDIGQTSARVEQVPVQGGKLTLELTEYPVFIEPM